MKKMILLLGMMLGMAYGHAQHIFIFNVIDDNTDNRHQVFVNTDNFTVAATDDKGNKIYEHKFYDHEKNDKGYIAFAFKPGQKPNFFENNDRYFFIASNMIVNTMEGPDNEFLYKPVNTNEFTNSFRQLDEQLAKIVYNISFKVNGVRMKMTKVKGGTFRMGSDGEQARPDEVPMHFVTLNDFYIGQTEVTQELWNAVMGNNPSKYKGDKLPVEQVSWDDCQAFVTRINAITGQRFRLPTEAEWEYAARGGDKSQGFTFAGSNNPNEVAWIHDNSSHTTHQVATLKPNELGIFDMSGNVWEWCQDWSANYTDAITTNPKGAARGTHRILRGGAFCYQPQNCRVSTRNREMPSKSFYGLGLRLAL